MGFQTIIKSVPIVNELPKNIGLLISTTTISKNIWKTLTVNSKSKNVITEPSSILSIVVHQKLGLLNTAVLIARKVLSFTALVKIDSVLDVEIQIQSNGLMTHYLDWLISNIIMLSLHSLKLSDMWPN